jgi:hypothetical protein
MSEHRTAPVPDLRILPIKIVHPHEEHDSQRAAPLLDRIRQAQLFTNPPIVAPMNDTEFVLLDGANRYHVLCELGYQHILVQVAPYESSFVELGVWQHIISGWETEALLERLHTLPHMSLKHGWEENAIAQVLLREGMTFSIDVPTDNIEQRNAALRNVVGIYQQQATLHRTALTDPMRIWHLYPDAIALILFPQYQPEDIIGAARYRAFLPPGISRHIIHGRALRLNYPLKILYDTKISLGEKNNTLQNWLRERLANRSVRYYAESTYQFDE